jgi:hypothetical protein
MGRDSTHPAGQRFQFVLCEVPDNRLGLDDGLQRLFRGQGLPMRDASGLVAGKDEPAEGGGTGGPRSRGDRGFSGTGYQVRDAVQSY